MPASCLQVAPLICPGKSWSSDMDVISRMKWEIINNITINNELGELSYEGSFTRIVTKRGRSFDIGWMKSKRWIWKTCVKLDLFYVQIIIHQNRSSAVDNARTNTCVGSANSHTNLSFIFLHEVALQSVRSPQVSRGYSVTVCGMKCFESKIIINMINPIKKIWIVLRASEALIIWYTLICSMEIERSSCDPCKIIALGCLQFDKTSRDFRMNDLRVMGLVLVQSPHRFAPSPSKKNFGIVSDI